VIRTYWTGGGGGPRAGETIKYRVGKPLRPQADGGDVNGGVFKKSLI